MTQDAHFSIKASKFSRARRWRLTWLAGPGRKAPSREFLEREAPPKTSARKRTERGQKALARGPALEHFGTSQRHLQL
jgi:hypothetical protein